LDKLKEVGRTHEN
jgi:hypothetical protein